jgi:hypothetical protein
LSLTCADDVTASKLLDAHDLVWEVDGLPRETYYNQSGGAVVVKAYATSRLEGTEVKVGVRLAKKGSGARRMMQEYSEEQTAAAIEEGGDPIDFNTDKIEGIKPVDSGGQQNITKNETLIRDRDFNNSTAGIVDDSEPPQNES